MGRRPYDEGEGAGVTSTDLRTGVDGDAETDLVISAETGRGEADGPFDEEGVMLRIGNAPVGVLMVRSRDLLRAR